MRKIKRTMACNTVLIGPNTKTNPPINGANARAARSAWRMAYVFGRISAKTRISNVMMAVAYATPASPKIPISALVANADAKMFTKLLPNKMVLNRCSLRSVSFSTMRARRLPLRFS